MNPQARRRSRHAITADGERFKVYPDQWWLVSNGKCMRGKGDAPIVYQSKREATMAIRRNKLDDTWRPLKIYFASAANGTTVPQR